MLFRCFAALLLPCASRSSDEEQRTEEASIIQKRVHGCLKKSGRYQTRDTRLESIIASLSPDHRPVRVSESTWRQGGSQSLNISTIETSKRLVWSTGEPGRKWAVQGTPPTSLAAWDCREGREAWMRLTQGTPGDAGAHTGTGPGQLAKAQQQKPRQAPFSLARGRDTCASKRC
ncbi:hypothetical protein E4U54_000078 [Claviceps lovelessii]|nr:hypothetical protein E4U54_000078 [Claviceps lovelessii]